MRNIGACMSTPPVTMTTPSTKAQTPRRSDKVLELTIGAPEIAVASKDCRPIKRQGRHSEFLRLSWLRRGVGDATSRLDLRRNAGEFMPRTVRKAAAPRG